MTIQNLNEFDQHSLAHWQDLAEKSLRDKSLAQLAHATAGGLHIEPLYTQRPDAIETLSAAKMQRWDNRLAVIDSNAINQNASIHEGLKGGVDSLEITLDSAEKSAAATIDSLETILIDVQLDIIPISLFTGDKFVQASAELKRIWSKQKIDSNKASAFFNADPMRTNAASELLIDMTTLAIDTHTEFPNVKAVCVNNVADHTAGASVEQELVSAIATATLYLQALLDAGMNKQAANDTLSFQMACDADTLENLVKLRSLKQLWIHVATEMGVPKPSLQLTIETSKRMHNKHLPWVNHLRNVSAATAAAMGGAQSIIVHPHNRINNNFIDTQIELSARVARNIPIILSEESGVTFVHDPMAGSYAVESLCKNTIDATWRSLQKIETDGGFAEALHSGRWQKALAQSQHERAQRLDAEQDIQIGVNKYKAKD